MSGIVVLALVLALGAQAWRTYREFEPFISTTQDVVSMSSKGVTLVDRNNQPFFRLYQANSPTYVLLTEVPQHFQEAVIAVEDHRFYNHIGFRILSIGRAAWVDVVNRQLLHGGSTITQQLVKNTLLSREKSFERKFKEVVLAAALEQRFSKAEILEMYLNTSYFGQGAVGIENAAQHYFAKSARELTPEESYVLVALLPSPSALLKQPERLVVRQKLVVRKLAELGKISGEAQKKFQPLFLATTSTTEAVPAVGVHFALMVKEALVAKYGEDALAQSGFTVKTTLDITKQTEAEKIVKQGVASLLRSRVHNGAAVVIDPRTGEVLALVGSQSWDEPRWGKVNMAVSPRQPGSSFKPIVYATAFEQRVATPVTILQDKPTTFGRDYKPENYDKHFRGPVTVRRALANSLNVPAVALMSQVGVRSVVAQAQQFGITTLADAADENLALALGAREVSLLELTGAYGVLANHGERVTPHLVLEVRDKLGKLVEEVSPKKEQAISTGAAYLTTSILSDSRTRQEVFGSALSFPRPVAVKTGTTSAYRDAWTLGFTPQVAVGVWIGNNDNLPMNQVAGALGAAPIWKQLMTTFTQGTPYQDFEKPAEVTQAKVCGRDEYFLAGALIPKNCPIPKPSPSPDPELVQTEVEKPKQAAKPKAKREDGWEQVSALE